MNKLVEAILDIYGQVGDFHITPFDGAIPVSEADEQAEKVVKVYTDALLVGACAENERLTKALRAIANGEVPPSVWPDLAVRYEKFALATLGEAE